MDDNENPGEEYHDALQYPESDDRLRYQDGEVIPQSRMLPNQTDTIPITQEDGYSNQPYYSPYQQQQQYYEQDSIAYVNEPTYYEQGYYGEYDPQFDMTPEEEEETNEMDKLKYQHHFKLHYNIAGDKGIPYYQPNPKGVPDASEIDVNSQRRKFLKITERMTGDEYYAWSDDHTAPFTKDEIYEMCLELKDIFGFQKDSVENIFDLFMKQLDSRSCRMFARHAMFTMHSDYIGGEHSNYRKWYFSTQIRHDPSFEKFFTKRTSFREIREEITLGFHCRNLQDGIEYLWRARMFRYSDRDLMIHMLLYLLIWGEANNIRFMPECLCFIYKTAIDHYVHLKANSVKITRSEGSFLDSIITPLYDYINAQQFKAVEGRLVRRERDHHKIIGYDDINQLFWYHEKMEALTLNDGTKFAQIPLFDRYQALSSVNWKAAFVKTYKENRSWWHLSVNFNRIWIIHFSMFWYYSSFNSPTLYTANYSQLLDNHPTPQARLTIMSLASSVACMVQIAASISEWRFLKSTWRDFVYQIRRLFLITFLLILNIAPTVFILGFIPLDSVSQLALGLSICQFILSIFTTLLFAIQPFDNLFYFFSSRRKIYDPIITFAASFPRLSTKGSIMSIGLWLVVFTAKFMESYFFLTLSVRDPVRNLSILDMSRCHGETYFGNTLCQYQNLIVLFLMMFTDMILFFLDTYLWYIIFNCLFSLAISFFSGMSILSPWKNIFQELTSRIYQKILSTAEMDVKYSQILLISQIWNGIVINMYREHLLSVEQTQKLLYHRIPNDYDGSTEIKTPAFFLFQNDNKSHKGDFFDPGSEAERRITFFAQSLSTSISGPVAIETMPSFTVLIPHYSEKILLGIAELIKEDPNSKVSLLEYLKFLFPREWQNFVLDTKILSYSDKVDDEQIEIELEKDDLQSKRAEDERDFLDNKVNEIPLYCVGYKSSNPTFTMRTRIWSSLRSQTLYRTVSGFMNYYRALKLLHKVENPEVIEFFGGSTNADAYLSSVAHKKFRLLVSMQRLQTFSPEEKEEVNFLIGTCEEIYIACLEEHVDERDGVTKYYSVLYEKNKDVEVGGLVQKYKIRLSGNPILGDGKSDNQNMSLIYYRGEYIQVIDANQDNYIEECMKIRSVLSEFEELVSYPRNPYIPGVRYTGSSPVAILGAREYIFSENAGVLGDVAAAKEQTFGTLFARTLSEIGGKLHYGHPDFLNAIFMTTRGGVSKAQKGLHLNEDIYAGITAMLRGGRIKHCDYFQCGKGRDLGFDSILNFTSKIGGGMGEQMLSREYYYLGTQLRIDRFLSFYYAHPGFHLNNLFIIFSLHVFMLVLINLGSMAHESVMCIYDKDVPITDLQIPIGCYNLQPVLDWVTRYILSIFICFFISFLPLMLHEISERGPWKAMSRLFFHFISFSPLFEVFVCEVYSNSLKSNLVFGGARYIGTGRTFAISRKPFAKLYSTYANTSIYSGSRLILFLLFGTVTMSNPALTWFWITLVSMCLSPFFFNPHQFARSEYFLDYRDYIRWLARGSTKLNGNSWISFTRNARSKLTGYKQKRYDEPRGVVTEDIHRAPLGNTVFAEIIIPLIHAMFTFCAYTFINAQNGVKEPEVRVVNSVLRVIILVFIPIAFHAVILAFLFPISAFASPLLTLCCKRFPGVLAALSHCLSVLFHCCFFQVIFFVEGWNFSRALCCLACVVNIQRVIFQTIKILCLSREMKEDYADRNWWSGKWLEHKARFGRHIFSQPIREFLVKIVEMSNFAADFFITHLIFLALTPFLFIPYIDTFHSCLLLWITPNQELRGPLYSIKVSKIRQRQAIKYGLLYFIILIFLICLILIPVVVGNFNVVSAKIDNFINFKDEYGLVQPNHQNNNDTGDAATVTVPRGKPTPVTWKTHWI